jgi:tRNA(Ile)-lysidine synthase/bifunctional protein TilS/HprT
MKKEFKRILKDYALLDSNKKILLAVSGGVDSIVLFHLLEGIEEEQRPNIAIAHINHQLRPESDAEERFVKTLAETYNIPFYLYTWKQADHPTNGVEEAAREIRYAFFKKVMRKHSIDVLMTGHHQDDQVETILMKLTRGSSLRQLTGIQERQIFGDGLLIRPLLSFTKETLYDFAHTNALEYVEDQSNQELLYSRNRFRNQIIPLLEEENVQFNRHIEQFSKDLTDLITIAEPVIEQVFADLVTVESSAISLKVLEFFELEEAMQRALLQRVFEVLYAGSEVSYKTDYIEIVRDWLETGAVNTQLDLVGDFSAKKSYNDVVFSEKEEASIIEDEVFSIGEVNEWVRISPSEEIGLFEYTSDDEIEDMLLIEGTLPMPLTIRHRKPGDRMTYAGLNGHKKIKDIFIDEKVPLENRDAAWVVEDATGRIIWLIGYRKMQLFRPKETDKLTYVVKYRKLPNG